MTNEEALEVLREKYIGIGANDLFVFRKAAEALEKQVPKRPKMKDVSRHIWDGTIEDRNLRVVDVDYRTQYICPSCGSILFECDGEAFEEWSEETKFCEHCGSAIDWSDAE